MIDKDRFEQAKHKIIGAERQRYGIGTLSEKTVHAVLKNYYEPNDDYHEVPVEGYVADIYKDGEIIEIQTSQFNRMRDKLKAFLPLYPVTIVYPIPREKWIIWVDEESGELSEKRKSPKKGSPYLLFKEIYKIKMFLNDKNLRIKLVLIDMEEYKLLNGWSKDKKKGSTKFDRIPIDICEEYELECSKDYMQFVPCDLEEEFTSKEYAKAAHIPVQLSQIVLNILFYLEIVERVDKRGNAIIYRVKY